MRIDEAILIMENERPRCGEKLTFTEEERYEAYTLALMALRDVQRVYDEGYKQGKYDEKVEAETSLQNGEQTHALRTETHACDLIKRQDAIDAAVEAADEWDGGYSRSREEIITLKLRMLPSAQPEIIRCEDCKHVQRWRSEESAKKFGQAYECARNVINCPKPDDFCSYAERKSNG